MVAGLELTGCSVVWLARLIWDQEVAGSNPVTPMITTVYSMVGMAQLVSAPDCGSGGRGFESHYPPLLKIWVTSSVGRALDF